MSEEPFNRIYERFDEVDRRFTARFDDVDKRFTTVDERFDAVAERFTKVDERFDGMDRRFDGVDKRLDGVDKRLDGVDKRLVGLDTRFDGVDESLKDLRRHMGVLHENALERLAARSEEPLATKADIKMLVEKIDNLAKQRIAPLEAAVRTLSRNQGPTPS